jgi:hypothetical protein
MLCHMLNALTGMRVAFLVNPGNCSRRHIYLPDTAIIHFIDLTVLPFIFVL